MQYGLKPIQYVDADGNEPFKSNKEKKNQEKKPRPVDLIHEKVMVGAKGVQPYSKKDFLGSHLLPQGWIQKDGEASLRALGGPAGEKS